MLARTGGERVLKLAAARRIFALRTVTMDIPCCIISMASMGTRVFESTTMSLASCEKAGPHLAEDASVVNWREYSGPPRGLEYDPAML